jgi:hypothetical protein
MAYKIQNNLTGIIIIKNNDDGSITSFGEWVGNTDYQAYLKWVSEGNTPEPAEA